MKITAAEAIFQGEVFRNQPPPEFTWEYPPKFRTFEQRGSGPRCSQCSKNGKKRCFLKWSKNVLSLLSRFEMILYYMALHGFSPWDQDACLLRCSQSVVHIFCRPANMIRFEMVTRLRPIHENSEISHIKNHKKNQQVLEL